MQLSGPIMSFQFRVEQPEPCSLWIGVRLTQLLYEGMIPCNMSEESEDQEVEDLFGERLDHINDQIQEFILQHYLPLPVFFQPT